MCVQMLQSKVSRCCRAGCARLSHGGVSVAVEGPAGDAAALPHGMQAVQDGDDHGHGLPPQLGHVAHELVQALAQHAGRVVRQRPASRCPSLGHEVVKCSRVAALHVTRALSWLTA